MKIITHVALLLTLIASSAFAGGAIKGKVVYKKKRWVRNTAVYLEHVKGDWKAEPVRIDQKGSTFIPKYNPVIVGSKVTFVNSDPTEHNVYSPDHEKYDLGVKPKGGELTHVFKKEGGYTLL